MCTYFKNSEKIYHIMETGINLSNEKKIKKKFNMIYK